MNKWVCAFRGRRDDYQIPLALEEREKLDQFITDAYSIRALRKLASGIPERWREVVRFRYRTGLPDKRVKSLWGTTLLEHIRHRVGYSRAATYAKLDQRYSEAAAARARKSKASLLLYTPYAWEAFTGKYSHQAKRVLFQYHPHAPYEARLLRKDAALHPEIAHSYAQETGLGLPETWRRRTDDCWQHADRVICASTFTLQTLLEAGVDAKRCAVVPYGIETELATACDDVAVARPDTKTFKALFVGSGVQRKGLHHLLRAWERAELPHESTLTLVCRTFDPGLRELVMRTPRVRLLAGVNPSELRQLYRSSTLFVMPSLIEGFGQVYLEALAQGCPVLGTANTCLPDLGTENDGIFLTPIANIDELVHRLEMLAQALPGRYELRQQAQACARTFTWPRFRDEVCKHLETIT